MLRLDRLLLSVAIAGGLLFASGCSRLTFVKPDLSKMEVEQVRQPVRARDNAAVKARESAYQLVAAASTAYQQGDIVGAEKNARAALKADPKSIDAHTLMGVIAGQRRRTAESGDWLKKAAQLSQGRPAEASNYGTWLCANGDAAGSLQYFDYAAQNQAGEDRAASLANAGTCALGVGMEQRADTYLQQAIQYDPQSALALESLANLSLKRGRAMDARAYIERRLDLPPVSASALSTAADVESRLGDTRAAAMYQQRLRSEFPNTNTPPPGN
ncbi:tetratricopeptide repeat protein [Solilutibacter tolerans]|uniref:Type IV pilus assembly protein PilF n=1 Tax=Solilutibacter tolerans TaxID=1604334 RepID=A0A1N6XSZ8_9GAMM|nr:tetratricopeptide repeat protein [Lysobacter tolerans]SIR05413.1 type IV pilus assembly protein PilF [Lysobacter tolerans]